VTALVDGISPQVFELIHQYGYWLMAFGAIIEGETFLVAGGIAAHMGLFHLWGLIALALVGSTLHDCTLFFLGRSFGHAIIKRKPQLYAKTEGVLLLFEKYGVLIIIALRFAYGLRTIIPSVLGMSRISARKFIFYDMIGGILWSTHLFWAAISLVLQLITSWLILGAGLVFFISMKVLKHKKSKKNAEEKL
jgi:membrane protein DedA with SNARE-associated domain